MGDGQRVKMSATQVKEDIAAGTEDAADRGKIPELTSAEQEYLFEIVADESRVVGVRPGEEVVLTDDVSYIRMNQDEGASGGLGIPMSPPISMLVHERAFAQDSAVLGATGFAGKAELNWKLQEVETTHLLLTVPMLYVSGPNLLTYYKPIGPYDNPSDLLTEGKIQEARETQEEAAAASTEDLVWLSKQLASVGVDCLNLDTIAAHGDTDFYVALKAVQKLKEVVPEMSIEMGMAAEFVMGMHGQITFNGQRLAGMYPHEQLKIAEAAGVDIFGPVVNNNSTKSFPWNISKVVTFVKHTSTVSNIPIHPNVGVGVCGVPMCPVPPVDCVSRVAKALVQIGKADGL
jgi:dimethylamine--corrinoid protein Co-methyltransferase